MAKRKTAKEQIKGQETFGGRRARLGKQGVSLREEARIIDNLMRRAQARGEKVSRREITRRFRTSQEFAISGKTKLKGGRVGGKIVSRKTGKRLRGGAKTPRSATPREAVLKTRPRTRRA